MGAIQDAIRGYYLAMVGGVPLTKRGALNFVGLGVAVADNPVTGTTDVTIDPTTTAAASSAAVANKLALRDGSAGCAFAALSASTLSVAGTGYASSQNLALITSDATPTTLPGWSLAASSGHAVYVELTVLAYTSTSGGLALKLRQDLFLANGAPSLVNHTDTLGTTNDTAGVLSSGGGVAVSISGGGVATIVCTGKASTGIAWKIDVTGRCA